MVHVIKTPPKVFLVGYSTPQIGAIGDYLNYRGVQWNTPDVANDDPLAIVEMAGRVCYHSWSNPRNRSRDNYIATQIIGHEHGSVLEHVWFNLLVADLPRSSQLELVRHGEGTAFSFESQRYTDVHLRFVVPPKLRQDPGCVAIFTAACQYEQSVYQELVTRLTAESTETGTLATKRPREAARGVLGGAAGSDGMVSVNGRAVRHIINLRSNEHADLSIREFAWAVYEAIQPVAPALFLDASVNYVNEDGIPVVHFQHPKV